MAAAGEQQLAGNQRLALVQTARAIVAAIGRSPALPIPRVSQCLSLGLAGASALQPQRKKRKAGNASMGGLHLLNWLACLTLSELSICAFLEAYFTPMAMAFTPGPEAAAFAAALKAGMAVPGKTSRSCVNVSHV
ncbi:hypothetical protein QJQ45_001244 [Haematococcus lacustris]|nr:hypothetical protein QJQ45_001244 [Haematococcus lacustris]